ncbi:stonustoxin subunit beta-like [Pseudorasbora parva]|uniref:stonustoxin subunit beta-like n=1 Tax=Pseudorasbora parva TaxID=51549 RepID=UPI00351EAEF2
MAALMMSLKQPSWIYCTCLWLATLVMVNAQEVIQPKPEKLQIVNENTKENTKYPALTSEPIEMAALGRPLFPGMLYDCRKDTFIPGVTLWDKKALSEDLDTRPQPKTDLKFSSSDSLSSKSNLLDVSASLKASFLAGLVEVGGSAKFLRDTKSSNQQSRVTMYYSETTRFEQLTMSHLGQITYPQVFDQKTATHVVTAVLYGAQAFMVFDRSFSEEEEKQEIEGELNVMVKKIPKFSIEGKGAIQMTDSDNKKADSITCTFYGDVRLEQNPTTFTEALEVYKKLPNILKENPQNAVPIKVWLHPLSLLDTKAARLEREITTRLVSNTADIIEELGEVERTCNDLSRRTMVNAFNERLRLLQDFLSIYKTMLLKAVSRVLPAIREGEIEEKSLEDILKIHYSSPFKADSLNQWLNDAKAELALLTSHTKMLEGIKTEDSEHLNTFLFNLNIDVVVCLTFTSLNYEDQYISTLKEFLKSDKFKELDGEQTMVSVASVRKWFNDHAVVSKMRENLLLFKSFSEANKDEKRYLFIMSAIPDPSSPGSSIRLYEKGKLTDPHFHPMSKPPPPEVKEVLKRSVSLKLQKSPNGETVQYRVEYRQVNEEQWHVINTPNEVFSLTGLKFGRQYLIRSRAVSRVGVSEASDTIGPITSTLAVPETRDDFLQYSLHPNLDMKTLHSWLRLSEGNRVITGIFQTEQYPDHSERFDYHPQVLCRESVSGRSYWEIEWSGIGIVGIAVSYKSICRKGGGDECGFGGNAQSWGLIWHPSRCVFVHKNIKTDLPVLSSRRVGVYVDHRAGTLSFYSVSGDSMSLIRTVRTRFTQPLYPGFTISLGSTVKLV